MSEELFQTYSEDGKPLGLVPRSRVHRDGLWHRAAHVFVLNAAGELLIQQRAHDKDLYAGLWDYSVGEHLQPGERFLDGARRGLREELGVDLDDLQPIGETRRMRHKGSFGVDAEELQAFVARCEGPFRPDPIEVAAVRFISMADLQAEIEADAGAFTVWFVRDLHELGFLS